MTRFRQASNDRRGDAINRGTSNDASGAWLSGLFKRSRLKRFGVIAVTLLAALLNGRHLDLATSKSG